MKALQRQHVRVHLLKLWVASGVDVAGDLAEWLYETKKFGSAAANPILIVGE